MGKTETQNTEAAKRHVLDYGDPGDFGMTIAEWCKTNVQKYKSKDGKTFCNLFVMHCAESQGILDFSIKDILANDMIQLMIARQDKFKEVDAVDAQKIANNDHFVIAAWFNPQLDGHGHVCIVIPGNLTWSETCNKDMPIVANAGQTCFYGRIASYAFKKEEPPRYWAYIG